MNQHDSTTDGSSVNMRTTADTTVTTSASASSNLQGSIVVVAKCPIPGKSKTRLVPLLGADGSALLARAMLSDVLLTLSECTLLESVQKILLYAPPTEQGRAMMQSILHDELQIAKTSWTLMPMLQERRGDDLHSSDLGTKLTDALIRARQLQREEDKEHKIVNDDPSSSCHALFPVVFLGMDSPELPLDEICAALHYPNTAVLCPANDGGYGMLSVPPNANARDVFSNMLWSNPLTAVCQLKALTDQGIPVRIGKLMYDMDEPDDVLALAHRLEEEARRRRQSQQPSSAATAAAVTDSEKQQSSAPSSTVESRDCLLLTSSSAANDDFATKRREAASLATTTTADGESSTLSASFCTHTERALTRLGHLPYNTTTKLSSSSSSSSSSKQHTS